MLTIRHADQRGHFKNDWLDSRHSFSFGEYYDPQHTGVSLLRVINDDRVAAGAGFPTHPHKNMEIISYVMQGELEHRDSLGNGSVIRPGDVQRMSAGTGVSHSEFNPASDAETHFLQIWLLPSEQYAKPGYEQKHFSAQQRRGVLKLLVSADGREGSVRVNSDALIYGALLDEGQCVRHQIASDRIVYVHVAKGGVHSDAGVLNGGDGVTVTAESQVEMCAIGQAELLLFDLPAVKQPLTAQEGA
jgi:quercetin 2,3-dioxygenase